MKMKVWLLRKWFMNHWKNSPGEYKGYQWDTKKCGLGRRQKKQM